MPLKVVDATVSNVNADQLRSEFQNNKPNFTLFLAATSFIIFCPVFFVSAYSTSDPGELRLVVSKLTTIQLSRGLPVKNSPGSIPETLMVCERVYIQGLPRFQNLRKVAHTVRVKVSMRNSSFRIPKVEVCFHKKMSFGLGMCPENQWEKIFKGSWARSMSPFDDNILDIRTPGLSLESFEVSLEEEFSQYRIIYLIMGVVLMSSASTMSKSLVFYYGSSMVIGILLVVLMILFQGMRLLPTARKNSLGFFLFTYAVCLVSFYCHYILGLLDHVLLEMGISKDMLNPLALKIFLLAFIFLIGTWLGFCVVHKYVHHDDGLVDSTVSLFVSWFIQILATFLILQCSLDPLLATGVLICGLLTSSMLRRIFKFRFRRRLYKKLFISPNKTPKISHMLDMPCLDAQDDQPRINRSQSNNLLIQSCSSFELDDDVYPSMFHSTPKQRKFSKDEWEKFTKDSTKKALEGLISSPDFSRWLADNADRINTTPPKL
uniref:Nuclear envelope integral membrane protein 1 n=1 Tax=Cucumis melo TaxID=3656 RepID=A0A9I9DVQ4_CUCME